MEVPRLEHVKASAAGWASPTSKVVVHQLWWSAGRGVGQQHEGLVEPCLALGFVACLLTTCNFTWGPDINVGGRLSRVPRPKRRCALGHPAWLVVVTFSSSFGWRARGCPTTLAPGIASQRDGVTFTNKDLRSTQTYHRTENRTSTYNFKRAIIIRSGLIVVPGVHCKSHKLGRQTSSSTLIESMPTSTVFRSTTKVVWVHENIVFRPPQINTSNLPANSPSIHARLPPM